MNKSRVFGGVAAGALTISLALLSPAIGASNRSDAAPKRASLELRDGIGSFTPAATDARLAAVLSRTGLSASGFRFTPASSVRLNRSVTVAVRARTNRPAAAVSEQAALVAPTVSSIAPIAYNLGVAVGWRKFAVTGDMTQMDIAGLGRRESVDVGVSYTNKRFSTRIQVAADRASGAVPRLLTNGPGVSVDLGSSYSLTRNLDVTAGVRYRAERERLLPQGDNRRDSQAVYVGTAIRF